MPTTFNVISIGVQADIDTIEGNNASENASALVGLTFGGSGDSLVNDFVSMSPVGSVGGFYDLDNSPSDQFSIDGGAAQTFDGTAIYNATVTYIDGSTDTITMVLYQDTAGNTYLAPEIGANPDQTALEAGAIRSITLDSVNRNTNLSGMGSNRQLWDFVTCFVAGTLITTPDGDVSIESLKAGDLVQTMDHGAQTIRWIGSTTVPATGKSAPVVISKGALGNDRELAVSPQHRMLLSGWKAELMFGEAEVLCAATHLVNGDTIYRREGGEVEYFHILFDSHEIVFAQGTPSESFHPGEQGFGNMAEETREEIFELFPELRNDLTSYGPTTRASLKGFEARAFSA